MISNNVVSATSKSLRSACAYAQSDQSLCFSLEYYIGVKLLTEYHLEFLRLKGRCTGSSESTLVKIPHCWKITCHGSNFYCYQIFVLDFVVVKPGTNTIPTHAIGATTSNEPTAKESPF